jgi:hypothetical protein
MQQSQTIVQRVTSSGTTTVYVHCVKRLGRVSVTT